MQINNLFTVALPRDPHDKQRQFFLGMTYNCILSLLNRTTTIKCLTGKVSQNANTLLFACIITDTHWVLAMGHINRKPRSDGTAGKFRLSQLYCSSWREWSARFSVMCITRQTCCVAIILFRLIVFPNTIPVTIFIYYAYYIDIKIILWYNLRTREVCRIAA